MRSGFTRYSTACSFIHPTACPTLVSIMSRFASGASGYATSRITCPWPANRRKSGCVRKSLSKACHAPPCRWMTASPLREMPSAGSHRSASRGEATFVPGWRTKSRVPLAGGGTGWIKRYFFVEVRICCTLSASNTGIKGSSPFATSRIWRSNNTEPERPATTAKGVYAIHPSRLPASPRRPRTGDQASAQSFGSQNTPPQIPGGNFRCRINPDNRLNPPKIVAAASIPVIFPS